jgi:thiol:disulfide interchange protein DsbA
VHRAVFDAVHVGRQKLDKEEQIIEFIEKQGVDKKKFVDTFNSFSVQSKVNRVRQLMEAYRIDGVPTVVIDGQYITSPSIVGSTLRGQSEQALNAATLQVMDALLAKKK